MIKSLLSILVLSFFIVVATSAQKLEEPTLEQLQQTHSSLDSSAAATILHSKCNTFFLMDPFRVYIEHEFQYQIHTEEGESYATFNIPFRENDKVNSIKATVYNLGANGQIEKTKLDKKDIYKEEVSKYYSEMNFALPKVKAGSIFNVSYTTVSKGFYAMPKWYFQHDIPSVYSEYVLKIPEAFNMTPITTGFVPIENNTKDLHSTDERLIQLIAKNVPAIADDDYVLNINDYKSSIVYELKSVKIPGYVNENYSSSWANIGDMLLEGIGQQLTKEIKPLKLQVAKFNALPKEERIDAVYDYVVANYTSTSFEKETSEKLKDLVEKKVGTPYQINLLLIYLLKQSDVIAFPVFSKYRSSGILNSHFPSITSVDHLMAYVIDGESNTRILDASSKYYPSNTIRPDVLNISGLLLLKGESRIVDLINRNVANSVEVMKYEFEDDFSHLTGTGARVLKGLSAVRYRIKADKKEDEVGEDKQNLFDEEEVELDENEEEEEEDFEDVTMIVNVENKDDINKPLKLELKQELYEATRKIGAEVFIDADLGNGIKKHPFTKDTRDFPIFFDYLQKYQGVYTINLPENAKVISQPKDTRIILGEKLADFTYSCNVVGGKITINYRLNFNTDIIVPSDYPDLKGFLDLVIAKQDEKISLLVE